MILIGFLGTAGFLVARDRGWFLSLPTLVEVGEHVGDKAQEVAEAAREAIEQAAPEITTPPPLRTFTDAPDPRLTVAGTFQETNRQRRENGLLELTLDAKLNAAAAAKVKDMFARQYFEHQSPTGEGPAQVVEAAGYSFIAVGENLALGNFQDDRELVQAWMDSPGHRANILGKGFTQIGVAVAQGLFEGKRTWLAVQEFARPASDCPRSDPALEGSIETNRTRIEAWGAEADARRAELESSKPKGREETEAYNARVAEYNELAARLNVLIEETKALIERYNAQVRDFNACTGG